MSLGSKTYKLAELVNLGMVSQKGGFNLGSQKPFSQTLLTTLSH